MCHAQRGQVIETARYILLSVTFTIILRRITHRDKITLSIRL